MPFSRRFIIFVQLRPMKNLLTLVIAGITTFCSAGMASAFVHPGTPLTTYDLDLIKANLDKEPWKSGYAALAADGHSQLTYTMQGPFAQVSRNPHINRNQWLSDMTAIYNLARMWYFTGNSAYAQKSHDILLAWANTQTSFDGIESNLDLGDQSFRYAGGADILRGTWPGWTQADTDAVKSLFGNVYWPASGAWTAAPGPANKGMLGLAAGVAIAVFDDDQAKLDLVLRMYRTAAACGLPNTLPIGEIGESGRDQGHAYGMWLSSSFVAEVFWKQGIDIYSEKDNRLMAEGEYFARNNLNIPTAYVPFGTTDALYWTNSGTGWGGGNRGLNTLYSAYVLRKGMSAPYIDLRRKQLPSDMDSFCFLKPADSSTATAAIPVIFPSTASATTGLTNQDIGTATPAGSGTYSNGTWTVQGAGTEIWTHGADSFHFVSKPVTGDCAIIARVDSVQNTAAGAKAGIMIRETGSADSMKAWVAIKPDQTAEFFMNGWTQVRGGSNWEKGARNLPQMPYWLKIERLGNTISLFTSIDGTSWATIGVGEFANWGSSAQIGLAVCSMTNGTLNTSTFSNVRITGADGGEAAKVPLAPWGVCASPGNKQVPLRWLESFGATSYKVKRATVSGGPYTTVGTTANSSYVDNTVANGTTYYYVITAVTSAGEGGSSPEDTVTPLAPRINVPYGGVATTNTDATGGTGPQAADKAFDENVNTKWFSGTNAGTTGWLQYAFPSGTTRTVTSYSIASANDVPGRDPRDWQLLGSNDGSTWITLDSRTGQSFANRLQTNTYTIASPGAYRYYRLNITAIFDPTVNCIQLSELSLWGAPASAYAQKFPVEAADQAFDGLTSTKWYSNDNAGTNGWLRYDFGVEGARILTGYSLTSANDVPGRDPRDWQLQGSNDGITWTTLDTQTGQLFTARFQTKSYSLAPTTTAYRTYRLNVTAIATASANAMQLAELSFKSSG